MSLIYNTNNIVGLPANVGGVRYLVPSDTVVDNVFVIQDGDNKFRIQPSGGGVYRPSWVLSSSGDKTTQLQTIVNHADVRTIIIDASFTINGTLTIPNGKRLKFYYGGYIGGSGTIIGGVISAAWNQNIFALSLNLQSVKTFNGKFWTEWYGASPDNGDNQPYFQKCADYISNNNVGTKNLRTGPGRFVTLKGVNFWRDTNGDGNPEFNNFTWKGNLGGYEYTGNETVIQCNHYDNFGINVQRGKGAIIDDMCITGRNQLNYSVSVAWGGASYLVGGVRSNSQSPYAGLVLDAIGSSTSGADRYPGFEDLYAGVDGNGGSTDCKFRNIAIDGFCCGVILSPNFNTQNNEAHTFDGFWFSNVKDGFVTTNSQERTVRCLNFKFWNTTHTCVRTNGYGAGRGEVPLIDTWNIAGNIYQLFNLGGSGGYFPVVTIKNFYAENFYWMGIVTGIVCKMSYCHFAFTDLKSTVPGQKQQTFMYVASDIEFDNSILLWYNGAEKVPCNVYGRTRFVNCYLSNPIAYADNGWTYDMYNIEYVNTRFYCEEGNTSPGSFESYGLAYSALTYGAQMELAMYNKEYCSYRINTFGLNSANYFAQYRRVKSPVIRRVPIGASVTVTVSGATAIVSGPRDFDPPAGSIIYAKDLSLYNGLVTVPGYAVMRAVTSNTFDRVIEGMVSGTYELYYMYTNRIQTVGFCDVAGTAVTNAVKEGQTSGFDMGVGDQFFSNLLQSVVASATGTATLLYNNGLGSANGVILCNYEYDEWGTSYCNPLENIFVNNGVAFTAGALYKNMRGAGASLPGGAENVNGWLCTRSGVKGSAVPPIFQEYNNVSV